jgi:FkbM family methyltransferase
MYVVCHEDCTFVLMAAKVSQKSQGIKTRLLNRLRRIFFWPPAERWLWRRSQKGGWKAFFYKFPPNPYQYPRQTLRTFERAGIRYQVDLSDYVGWRCYWNIDEGLSAFLEQLRPGDTLLDIGANIGEYSLGAARKVGPEGQVLSFEPFPETYRQLQHNLSLNPGLAERVQCFSLAVGEKAAEGYLIQPRPGNRGMVRFAKEEKGEKVKIVSLDAHPPLHSLPQLDGIKLDVEGYELPVLKGAEQVLRRFRPWLWIELDDANLRAQGASARELLAWLSERGYQARRADTGLEIDETTPLQGCHFDMIATS